jgi:protein-S-isoprenylcysteine O-methyltransferase Ste14
MTTTAIKLLAFLLASAVLVYVSRASLLLPRSHGFYRFFAWEAILGMVLLNLDHWFHDPLSPAQVASWVLLFVSAFLVVHVARLLKIVGKPDLRRTDEALFKLEKTTRLVTVGAYRYIRHPAYASLLFLAWGVFFKNTSWLPGLLVFAATVFLVLTAKAEEAENIRFFGMEYGEYMRKTKMFVPFVL